MTLHVELNNLRISDVCFFVVFFCDLKMYSFFKVASNVFELNFVPLANHCVVERRAIFKQMLDVTTDLKVYVQLCFGMSSVKQFLQIEVNWFVLSAAILC